MTEPTATTTRDLVDRYRHSGFFVLRSPLLPIGALATWGRYARGSEDAPDILRRRLANLLDAPHCADAIRVASPTLASSLSGWTDRKPSRRRDRIERSLVQYFARMCDRCTPFGLFAGVSVGAIGTTTSLQIASRTQYRRRSLLDSRRLAELLADLLHKDEVRQTVRYRLNDTFAAVNGAWQYTRTIDGQDHVGHEISSLEDDEGLSIVLERVAEGATLGELRTALAANLPDKVPESEIDDFLNDLIAAQVLQPELVPAVVADEDPLDHILQYLEGTANLAAAANSVRQIRQELNRLDRHGVSAPPEAYAALNKVWTTKLQLTETDRLLHIDLFKDGHRLCLSPDLVAEVLRGAEPLSWLAGPLPDDMQEMKTRFRDRYESREVPLAEAFDPECGIGTPGPNFEPRVTAPPLLNGLEIRASLGRDGLTDHSKQTSRALLDRIMEGCDLKHPLELDDELLDRLRSPEVGDLPGALGVHFDLIARSEGAVRRGDYRLFFHGAVGPSGARMLGRFCDLDPVLLEAVRDHLRAEEALEPDAIYAEIVHSPQGRLSNIVRRPRLRDVELSCNGSSRRERSRCLTVDDLLLRLEGGQFLLRSKRDGRPVRPRLTSAHNYRRSSGVYRFLCALQNDGVREGLAWTWGSLDGLPFLPRVIRGRAIYAVARWRAGRERSVYRAIRAARTRGTRDGATAELIRELRLPRWVRLADGDNRLLLDLENPLCLSVLAEHAAARPSVTLEETLAEDIEGCIEGPEGKYRNEMILPFVRTSESATGPDKGKNARDRVMTVPWSRPRPVQRVFAPGDEWLYFKFYCGHPTIDLLLREVVPPLVALHEGLEPNRPWFFVRYADPENHLRLRFRAAPETQRELQERAVRLLRPFVERRSVHRAVGMDTYVREVERYGGPLGIGLAESWFRADSAAAMHIVELVHATGDEVLRWKAVAMGFDRLLADFGLDFGERDRVVTDARAWFAREFEVSPTARHQLAQRLRAEKRGLLELVTGRLEGPLAAAHKAFRRRSAQTVGVVRRFRELAETGELECPVDGLLHSLSHMQANRILPALARAQELVLHDLLSRTYRSLIAHPRGN